MCAGLQEILGYGFRRKILIAFDDYGVVALGNDLATQKAFAMLLAPRGRARLVLAREISLAEHLMRRMRKRFR